MMEMLDYGGWVPRLVATQAMAGARASTSCGTRSSSTTRTCARRARSPPNGARPTNTACARWSLGALERRVESAGGARCPTAAIRMPPPTTCSALRRRAEPAVPRRCGVRRRTRPSATVTRERFHRSVLRLGRRGRDLSLADVRGLARARVSFVRRLSRGAALLSARAHPVPQPVLGISGRRRRCCLWWTFAPLAFSAIGCSARSSCLRSDAAAARAGVLRARVRVRRRRRCSRRGRPHVSVAS